MDVELSVARYRTIARLPVRQGAQLKEGSDSFEVTKVLQDPLELTLVAQKGRLQLLILHGLSALEALGFDEPYVLMNQSTGVAVLAKSQSMGRPLVFWGLLGEAGGTYRLQSLLLRFSGKDSEGKSIVLDDSWLAAAQLICLRSQNLGRFTKTLRADFRMNPADWSGEMGDTHALAS